MNTFYSILLIVILVLIVSDVYFLRKILKNLDKKKMDLPDERYFELKYNINLLKAVAAILIFLMGFLGFNTYNSISENLNKNFTDKVKTQNEKIDRQNQKIDSLISLVMSYEESIKSLKVEEGESVKNLGEINHKFAIISDKLKNNQEALKYTTKVYVISNLKYPNNIPHKKNRSEAFTIKFEDLRTIYNEKLPKFKSKPMLVLHGNSSQLIIVDLTKEYVRIELTINITYENDEKTEPDFLYFDMWIAEPN